MEANTCFSLGNQEFEATNVKIQQFTAENYSKLSHFLRKKMEIKFHIKESRFLISAKKIVLAREIKICVRVEKLWIAKKTLEMIQLCKRVVGI